MDRSATSPPGESAFALHSPSRHRKPGPTLYLYAAREALRPFLFALIGLTLIVLTRDLIVFSQLIINRGIGADQVALIAFYEAVPVASQIYPFAVLIGALVALGRLGADREILALEASGVSAPRLVWPIACFAALVPVVVGRAVRRPHTGHDARAHRAPAALGEFARRCRQPLRRVAGRGARGVGPG
jgi:hypothetical protein